MSRSTVGLEEIEGADGGVENGGGPGVSTVPVGVPVGVRTVPVGVAVGILVGVSAGGAVGTSWIGTVVSTRRSSIRVSSLTEKSSLP
jgi:phage tail tape-measure protein